MMDLDLRRRFFAEELEAVCKLRSSSLVDAFAAVPREAFLPPGPWVVLADADFGTGPAKTRLTPDADPARVCHNIAVAIDAERQLFNGQPGTIGTWIDALELARDARVLHVGCGLGYYTAVMAHCAGSAGRVLAFEADDELAGAARRNLASMPWVEVRADAASQPEGETFDAVLVNAGVTHPLDVWLDALAPGGRLILPMTSTMVPMGNIGKGLVFLVSGQRRCLRSASHRVRGHLFSGRHPRRLAERSAEHADDGRTSAVASRHTAAPRDTRPHSGLLASWPVVLLVSVGKDQSAGKAELAAGQSA